MRKTTPFLILAVGLLALAIDLLPNLKLPNTGAEGGFRPIETKLGLDLRGGLRVEYQVQPVDGVTPTAVDVATIRDIIERRVNSTGVAEPLVQTQGTDRIVVELPGVSDPDAVRSLLGTTGRLDFVPLPKEVYGSVDVSGGGGSTPGIKVVPVKGEKLFVANCAACHQATGLGVPNAFPPLAGSPWVAGNEERMIKEIGRAHV